MSAWQWWLSKFRRGWAANPEAAEEAHVAALKATAALGAVQERSREVSEVAERLRQARARNGFAEAFTESITPRLKGDGNVER